MMKHVVIRWAYQHATRAFGSLCYHRAATRASITQAEVARRHARSGRLILGFRKLLARWQQHLRTVHLFRQAVHLAVHPSARRTIIGFQRIVVSAAAARARRTVWRCLLGFYWQKLRAREAWVLRQSRERLRRRASALAHRCRRALHLLASHTFSGRRRMMERAHSRGFWKGNAISTALVSWQAIVAARRLMATLLRRWRHVCKRRAFAKLQKYFRDAKVGRAIALLGGRTGLRGQTLVALRRLSAYQYVTARQRGRQVVATRAAVSCALRRGLNRLGAWARSRGHLRRSSRQLTLLRKTRALGTWRAFARLLQRVADRSGQAFLSSRKGGKHRGFAAFRQAQLTHRAALLLLGVITKEGATLACRRALAALRTNALAERRRHASGRLMSSSVFGRRLAALMHPLELTHVLRADRALHKWRATAAVIAAEAKMARLQALIGAEEKLRRSGPHGLLPSQPPRATSAAGHSGALSSRQPRVRSTFDKLFGVLEAWEGFRLRPAFGAWARVADVA